MNLSCDERLGLYSGRFGFIIDERAAGPKPIESGGSDICQLGRMGSEAASLIGEGNAGGGSEPLETSDFEAIDEEQD